jgi:Ca2+-binding RTX toxin-like protein
VVDKGTSGASGIDTLTNIKTIIGAVRQDNIVDASSITSSTITVSANLITHALSVNNIPSVGTLSFNIYNFETIIGTSGADTFVGDNLNDRFVGGAGSSFTTGTGHNTLTGGGSNDVFNFGGGHDTITDFSISGGDIINSAFVLKSVTDTTSGALLRFAGGGTITLTGVTAANFMSAESTDYKQT